MLSPLQAVLVSVEVVVDQPVVAGQELAVVEAMKMQHVIKAPSAGVVVEIYTEPGMTLDAGQAILLVRPEEGVETKQVELVKQDLSLVRPDLKALEDRLAITLDKRAPDAVAKLRTRGQRTARENLTDLCDAGSFLEYGQLVYAAQRSKIDKDSLMRLSPADGIVAGFASINGDLFGDAADEHTTRAAVLSYDAMVMAGTQGTHGHKKTDPYTRRRHRTFIAPGVF